MVGVLVVVAYGMYVSINSGPVQVPSEVEGDWPAGPPQVSLSGPGGEAPPFAMEGPSGFSSPGAPQIEPRSDALSPSRPFSERGPAPPSQPAPMPPEIASNVDAPMPRAPSDAPPYPSYAPNAPAIGANADVSNTPAQPPLPEVTNVRGKHRFRMSNVGSAPPLPPPASTHTLAGMDQLVDPAENEIRATLRPISCRVSKQSGPRSLSRDIGDSQLALRRTGPDPCGGWPL